MPHLSIKNVPEALAERLRLRAALNHRSLQGELMAIIEQAVETPATRDAAAVAPADVHAPRTGRKTIMQIAEEHRARYPAPLAGSPRAVDILRAERDGR
ncbi:FitA-like ribbon-helix-helix domain-containing protein [Pseudothauera rhizosphaerae]|uniref:Arc family DNA-binding protein n=1 Tax=Pseudothauera rhizosphaerae TaxID=2565932 RepID=A0A4S4B0A3_9RHOO|nr:Arc family DNA-binding protein [Pseudothauera rhizosphaerae]THF65054.1 Arc family DNA-binding protein [Pseudothauera rhizosphaerae]